MGGAYHITHMGKITNANKILSVGPEGKRPLGRLRHRWKDYMGMDLKGIRWVGVDCMDRAQNNSELL